MTIQEAINKVIKLAENEIGYKPYSGKRTKFADEVDAIKWFYNGPKSGFDWCDVFYDWLFVHSFGADNAIAMLYQPKRSTGAGCGYSANFYRRNNAFSKLPQRGAQIFYGKAGNEYHTGLVYDFDSTYVYTIEGNIGGGNGKVGKKKVLRTSDISGYGIPNWSVVAKEKDKPFEKQWGIDISAWQGNYNLAQAQKEGVKFVILKGGGGDDGLYKDSRFEENYQKAKALKMPVGVYWFSRALNDVQAKSEAEFFYQNCLKGKQFELPIYIDVENKTQLNIGKRKLTDVIKTWLTYIRNKGYWVGIYSSTSYFSSYMYDDELKSYAHWVADWRNKCYYPSYYGMWQFGGETNKIRSNKVAGQITDQNYMLENYEKEIKAKGLNGWGKNTPVTPTPAPKPKLDVDGVLGYNSVVALQKWMNAYQDGEISNQIKAQSVYFPALHAVTYGRGGSACIKALQSYLTKQGFNAGEVDGYLGKNTITALQKFLNKNGAKLTVDGYLGTNTAKALQSYLNKTVYK